MCVCDTVAPQSATPQSATNCAITPWLGRDKFHNLERSMWKEVYQERARAGALAVVPATLDTGSLELQTPGQTIYQVGSPGKTWDMGKQTR